MMAIGLVLGVAAAAGAGAVGYPFLRRRQLRDREQRLNERRNKNIAQDEKWAGSRMRKRDQRLAYRDPAEGGVD